MEQKQDYNTSDTNRPPQLIYSSIYLHFSYFEGPIINKIPLLLTLFTSNNIGCPPPINSTRVTLAKKVLVSKVIISTSWNRKKLPRTNWSPCLPKRINPIHLLSPPPPKPLGRSLFGRGRRSQVVRREGERRTRQRRTLRERRARR